MKYHLISSNIFLDQIKNLDLKSKRIIKDKINLIKSNPHRFKRVHSRLFSKVFRIRLNVENKSTRLIYVIINPNIILVCLLERKKGYKDLEKYLEKLKKD